MILQGLWLDKEQYRADLVECVDYFMCARGIE